MFFSALFFALMGGSVKAAFLRGIPVLEILAARALISLVLSYLDIRRQRISPWGNNRFLLFARGAMGTAALICLFYAVTILPLAEATLLQYMYPVFTSALAFFFLKEKIFKRTIVSILMSLAGVVVMVQPGFLFAAHGIEEHAIPLSGVLAALCAALGTSIAYVLVRRLSATESPSVIIFYFPLVALPVACLLLGKNVVVPQGISWIFLVAVGVFTQIAQLFLTFAIKNETAGRVTAFSYIQVVFAAILGWFFFDEHLTITTILGAVFIIGGAMVGVFAAQKK